MPRQAMLRWHARLCRHRRDSTLASGGEEGARSRYRPITEAISHLAASQRCVYFSRDISAVWLFIKCQRALIIHFCAIRSFITAAAISRTPTKDIMMVRLAVPRAIIDRRIEPCIFRSASIIAVISLTLHDNSASISDFSISRHAPAFIAFP